MVVDSGRHCDAVCRPSPNGDPRLSPNPAAPAAHTPWQHWLEIGRAQKRRFDAAHRLPVAPGRVLLFSGHMVDAPGRPIPRFRPEQVDAAATRIAALLDGLAAGPDDLAFTQGAGGGDLLFAEACLARAVPLQLLLPQPERVFARDSLRPSAGGLAWRPRFDAVKARCAAPPVVLRDAVPDPPAAANIYEQCNQWLLATAVAYGIDRLNFICLWDGGAGDGLGGTRHFVDEVRRMGGRTHWIDVRHL
jgi:hypothetical protein